MSVKYYSNKTEWKQLKKEANAKGESTIHDDFIDKNGSTTNGKSGRLTFRVIPVEPPTKHFLLTKKLQTQDLNIKEINDFLR